MIRTRRPADTRPANARRGAVLILVCLFMTALMAFVAYTIDVGQMTMLRAEIQNGVDAGTLAAQLQLQMDPNNPEKAEAVAKEFVNRNRIGSNLVPNDAIDVEVGVWNDELGTFVATPTGANAVRVYARQDQQGLSFGRLSKYDTFGAPAEAIASGSSSTNDIVLVLDLSGSMLYQGRIEALRNSAPAFIELIDDLGSGDQIGVMGYSADPSKFDASRISGDAYLYNSGLHPSSSHHVGVMEKPMTSDLPSIIPFLGVERLKASKYQGWTGTGAALGDGAHYVVFGQEARKAANKILVLMSDGHANRPPGNGPGYAREMAAYAAGLDVTVHTISLGNSADEKLMQDIADIAGGQHFVAAGKGEAALTATLTEAFSEIAGKVKATSLVK